MEVTTTTYKIDTMLALCEILKKYERFSINLDKIVYKKNKNKSKNLYNLIQGIAYKNFFRFYKFIVENEEIIGILKKYNTVKEFIVDRYDENGIKKDNYFIDNLYDYLIENRDKLDIIISNLQHLKKLRIETVIFGEDLDFTNTDYELETVFNKFIVMLDNIIIIPNYDKEVIRYRTIDSDYRLILKSGFNGNIYDRNGFTIELNTLAFDKKTLPKTLTKEDTYGLIVKLRDNNKDTKIMKNAIDLSIACENFKTIYTKTCELIKEIPNLKNKSEIESILLDIKENIRLLYDESLVYQHQVIDDSYSLTQESIDSEKALVFGKRIDKYCIEEK